MTTPNPTPSSREARASVTQADREAAANYLCDDRHLESVSAQLIREGKWDRAPVVQAFARHRLAAAEQPPAPDSNVLPDREAIRAEIVNTPETTDFMAGVPIEATHQRERWGASHDAGKSPFDWFWLIGYLAQKAASAQMHGDTEKAKHHTISTAAALANWHAQLSGHTDMRPGIGPGNGGDKPGSAFAMAAALQPPEEPKP